MSKEIASAYVEAVFNGGDLSRIDEFVAPDIIDHSAPPGLPPGLEGQKMKVSAFRQAFPDIRIDYAFQIVDGDMVGGRFTLTGTHRGDFAGLPATGKKISVTGHDFLRFRDGKISEHWAELDTMSMMQQLGAV